MNKQATEQVQFIPLVFTNRGPIWIGSYINNRGEVAPVYSAN